MADDANDTKKQDAGPARMKVAVARPTSVTTVAGSGEASVRSLDSTSVELDPSTGLAPESQEDEREGGDGAAPEKPEGEQEDTPSEDALPDYDGANEEVRAKYDEKYFTPEGTVNLGVLTTEFFANEAKGEGKLNPGTYAYLKDSLGLDEAAVHEIERGQLSLRTERERVFYSRIEGGKQAYESAVQWGLQGGYNETQMAAYNEAQSKGGQAFEDQVDLLMVRFRKANGGAPGNRRGPPQNRRPSSPQRDVAGGARTAAPDAGPKLNQQEYGKQWGEALGAVAEARRSGDKAAIRAAEAKRDDLRRRARQQGLRS